jgi:hypothetical protein
VSINEEQPTDSHVKWFGRPIIALPENIHAIPKCKMPETHRSFIKTLSTKAEEEVEKDVAQRNKKKTKGRKANLLDAGLSLSKFITSARILHMAATVPKIAKIIVTEGPDKGWNLEVDEIEKKNWHLDASGSPYETHLAAMIKISTKFKLLKWLLLDSLKKATDYRNRPENLIIFSTSPASK